MSASLFIVSRSNRSRNGVALIIALIILASLLLLGLPFLFSQSESLAGSRSYAYHEATAVGLQNGEQLAAAAVAYGLERHLQVAGHAYSRQDDDLIYTGLMNANGILNANTFALDTQYIAVGPRQARSGSWIEDEHGKLNPNFLSPQAWTALLGAIGIQDWDDNRALDSQDLTPDRDPARDEDGLEGLDGLANSNGDNDDGDNFGELAKALANLRFTLPGRIITSIDQLLLADPGHNIHAGPGPTDYRGDADPTQSYGFRRPLTHAELHRLRPYLTLFTPAPGRHGVIDLGSVVASKSPTPPNTGRPLIFIDDDPYPFIRNGSAATWPQTSEAEDFAFGRVIGIQSSNFDTSIRFDSQYDPAPPTDPRSPIALSAPPPVNVHHALSPIIAALDAYAQSTTAEHISDFIDPLTRVPTRNFQRVDPLSSGVELPPVGIASKGVISITAGAAVADQFGRIAAERHRKTVVQAVPTQIDLEERWRAQDEFHALMVQRFTSHMVTWPEPTQRVIDQLPDIALTSGDPARPIGLGAAPLPSLATGYRHQRESDPVNRQATHLNIDFRVPFGADQAVAATELALDRRDGNNPKLSAPTVPVSVDQLRPDGLRINGQFSWHSAPEDTSGPTPTSAYGPLRVAHPSNDRSLSGRHLSFWFKPNTDWSNNGMYTLLECRSPGLPTSGNLGNQIDGTLGSNELQNRLSVVYDRERQLIITVIAPPIIEHTSDWGPRIPFDDLTPGTSAHIDERCLGVPSAEAAPYGRNAPTNYLPLAPQQPYPGLSGPITLWDEPGALFSQKVSPLYKPNTIAHLYKVADPTSSLGGTQPFFRKDRWYSVQLVLAGDRPGDVLTIIDNVVGQDVSRIPPASVAAMETGDRLTLPAMPLATALALVAQPPPGGGAEYIVAEITVLPVLGLTAEQLYPQRGVIRIDDEYIAYESVQGNVFKNCQRGQRQNSRTDGALNEQWPLTQEHLVGASVVPGGYRIHLDRGTLYQGGAALAEPLTNGDPAQQWRLWAKLDITGPTVVSAISPAPYTVPTTATQIQLQSNPGVPNQFPLNGIIEVDGQVLLYTRTSASDLNLTIISDLSSLSGFTTAPGPNFPARTAIIIPNPSSGPVAPDVTLIGIPLIGANPLDAGRYKLANIPNPGDAFLIQFRHPSGRVEWAGYTDMTTGPNPLNYPGFLINRFGWDKNSRGQQRTDFVGQSAQTHLTVNHTFPTGSLVLPVQTEIGGPGHWVMTGDTVTLIPKFPETGLRPQQAIVRYATVDGLDTTGGNGPPTDTKNEYFAFDHELPAAIPGAAYDLAVWPGWSGVDLTPMNPTEAIRGTPLRLDLAAVDSDPRNGFDLAILSRSSERITPDEANALPSNSPTTVETTIDALVGGNLDGRFHNPEVQHGLIGAIDASGNAITANLARVGMIVEASHNQFFPRAFGLVNIAGEVFTYRQLRGSDSVSGVNLDENRHAMLIARGLLDLTDPTPTVVTLPVGPLRGGTMLRPLVPAFPLPIGPVAQLTGDITDHVFFNVDTGVNNRGGSNESVSRDHLDAPYAFICTPDGNANTATIMGFAGGARQRRGSTNPPIWDTEYVTAPWLRGMYNTEPSGAGAAGDIVIGWWPRVASARPASPNGTDEAPYHRSRRFGWVGLPMAMHGARFDVVTTPAQVVIDNSASRTHDLLEFEARAASERDPDWTRPALPMVPWFGDIPTPALTPLFVGTDFANKDVSGAELRVSWRYATNVTTSSRLDAIAEAGSRGPFIQSAFLRWRAPMAVLAVEEAR